MKTNVLGVQYDNVTMAEALDTARALLQRPEASYCVTPNAEMAYEALHDESFRAILNEASLVLPDGAGGVIVGAWTITAMLPIQSFPSRLYCTM